MKKFEKIAASLIHTAGLVNFYGKRTLDSFLKASEDIIKELELDDVEPRDLMEWLQANKPVKPEKAKKADNKPAADTMTGQAITRADSLEVRQVERMAIVTAAQNNTQVCPDTFSELKRVSESLDADLIVLPIHYNKNAFSAAVEDESEYFAEEVKPYLLEADTWLIDKGVIRLAPEAHVLPTAKYPVNAAATLNAGELATVIPATKQQLKTLPRLNGQPIKEAWSTGCCTVYNYTATRAGAEAEVEHVFGGLLVVVYEDGTHNIVNLELGDDKTIDLALPNQQPVDVVLGDLHSEVYDPVCWEKTLEFLNGVSSSRGISTISVHDILHFSTRSHHNRQSGKHIYANKGRTVQDDLTQVITQLNELAAIADIYVVESNHNSAIDNWLDDSTYKPQTDAQNSKLYYLLNWLICDAIDEGQDTILALELALQNTDMAGLPKLANNIEFGRMDKPKIVSGYDLSCHGHKGQNGSAGNPNLFSKWRLKMVTGHTHSPNITGGVVTVGVTARLDQGYNRGGASSWAQSHAIVFPNSTCRIVPMNKRG